MGLSMLLSELFKLHVILFPVPGERSSWNSMTIKKIRAPLHIILNVLLMLGSL